MCTLATWQTPAPQHAERVRQHAEALGALSWRSSLAGDKIVARFPRAALAALSDAQLRPAALVDALDTVVRPRPAAQADKPRAPSARRATRAAADAAPAVGDRAYDCLFDKVCENFLAPHALFPPVPPRGRCSHTRPRTPFAAHA